MSWLTRRDPRSSYRAVTTVTQSAAPRRLGLALSNESPIAETISLARQAEDLGFSEVWLPESSHGTARGPASAAGTSARAVALATRKVRRVGCMDPPIWLAT